MAKSLYKYLQNAERYLLIYYYFENPLNTH